MSIESSNEQCVVCEYRSECFDVLSNKQLADLAESKLQIQFKKGETIRKQGSFNRGVLYLKKGYAKVYREMEHVDQNCIVAFHQPGEMIGLSELFAGKIARYSVVAMTNCSVCCIELETFQEILNSNQEFAANIIKIINEQNNILFDFQIMNNHKQLHGRFAEALLFLRSHVFKTDSFSVPLTRRDLAEFTNMSTMSVVRILKSFKEDGLVEDKNGHIHILNVEKLKTISKIG
jgi:CRP-like cAMP-binding protein